MKNSKRLLLLLLLLTLVIVPAAGCTTDTSESQPAEVEVNDGTYQGQGSGYGGPLEVEVTVADGAITDLVVNEHNESTPVYNRALPVLKERILAANSPQVDTVTAASFTSFAVKTAVSEAMKEAGHDFDEIRFQEEASEEETETPQLDAVETGIVIVGGGPAGISAAITAKEAGADDILLIEKLDILGGNGKFDMNFYDLINSEAQKAQGIELDVDDFLEMKENARDTKERFTVWGEMSYELDAWFRDMGIELNHAYGATNHMSEEDEYAGEEIHDHLEEKLRELDIEVRTGTKAVDLIIEDGQAAGIKAESKDGTYDIRAKAVVVATGGFASNKELLAQYVPGAEELATSNQIGTTGDMIPVFEAHDLQLGNMERLNVFPFIVRHSRDLTGGADDFILVNENGERFVTENGRGLDFGHVILQQPGKKAYYLYDDEAFHSAYRLQKHVDLGYHTKADTLEELAEALGIDADNLTQTVETYNQAIRGETTDPFRGDDVFERPFAESGPYYGVEVESAIHMTLGGVVANEKGQVLTGDNTPVEGLYAAGEVTDVSGAFNAAIAFGRITGKEAAAYVSGQ